MSENTEKTVLMKCKRCKYQEEVPEWVLLELEEFSPSGDKPRNMCCPNCDDTMYEVIIDTHKS